MVVGPVTVMRYLRWRVSKIPWMAQHLAYKLSMGKNITPKSVVYGAHVFLRNVLGELLQRHGQGLLRSRIASKSPSRA